MLSEDGVLEWIGLRSLGEDSDDDHHLVGESKDGNGSSAVGDRVKLFNEPAVQAFVAWIQEEEDDDEDEEDEGEEEDSS